MSCKEDPETVADEFHLFIKAVKDSCIELEVETGRFHPLTRTLALWADVHGFVSTATWTKKILVGLLAPSCLNEFWLSLGWGHDEAANLLACFGRAFRGDMVGHVGRDIVEPCLQADDPGVFAAAVGVLESWLDDDEDGTWQALLENYTELEDEDDEQLELPLEMSGSSEENLADITMGPNFKDPSIKGLKKLFETSGNSELEDEDELPKTRRDIELEPYFEAGRALGNSCRALVRHRELPGFLARVVGLDQAVTLGLLESQQLGHPCVRQSTLEVHVEGQIVRAWNAEVAVSIEPTATSGTWLVFARWG